MKIGSMISLFVLILVSATQAQAAALKEGKWQVTVSVSTSGMPNMPNMAPPKSTHTHCVKKGEGDPKEAYRMMTEQNCKVSDVKVSGDTASWKMKCDMQGMTTEGQGSITSKGSTYDGTSEMTMQMPGGMSMKTSTKFSGKWLAPGC